MTLYQILLVLLFTGFVHSELLQAHVLFSNNEYVPLSYPGDIYTKFPHFKLFSGILTEKGELAAYKLGSLLNQRYINYLPKLYSTNVSESFATNTQSAQASLQCVHLGLFPPCEEQKFSDLNWQPIPYRTLKGQKDKFLSPLEFCNKSWKLPRDPNCDQLSKLLTQKTSNNVSNNEDIFNIFNSIQYQEKNKFDLPKWADEEVWESLEICSEAYFEQLVQLRVDIATGRLLQRISKLALDKQNNELLPPDRKVYLYSGDIYSVPLMLTALSRTLNVDNDIFSSMMLADITSILFELHDENGEIGFKLFYRKQMEDQLEEIDFRALNTFIGLGEFISKTQILYGSTVKCYY